MKRILPLFVLLTLPCFLFAASQADSLGATADKVSFKFGGRIDLLIYSDSYNSVEIRNGAHYYFPQAPLYNDYGEDINKSGRLRMSIAPTRLNGSVFVPELIGANGMGFVEIDFMGSNESTLGAIRMRHAYFSLQWKRTRITAGQTSHLAMVDELSPLAVSYGGGNPIAPLNRPIQVQFGAKVGHGHGNMTLTAAAAFFSGETGRAQSYAFLPDIHIKFAAGNVNDGLYGGVLGGYKLLKPRDLTEDLTKAKKTVGSWDVAAFGKYSFAKGYSVKLYGIWGQDLSPLSMLGGYAPLLSDQGKPDYGYAPVSSYSAWVDFETKRYSGWAAGIFGGVQKYLGASKDIDLANPAAANRIAYYEVEGFWRVAPRVSFTYKKLYFGLEYMISSARWAEQLNNDYTAARSYPDTYNNRVTILARFAF